MAGYLDTIVAAHRRMAERDRRSPEEMVERALAASGDSGTRPSRPFTQAIVASASSRGVAIIAEIKRRSPSKGALDPRLDPAIVAAAYEEGGAACLSVLTDQQFFGGSPADLAQAREGCSLPVLRKDFTVSAIDLCDAVLMGADAVLLIASVLDEVELPRLIGLAGRLGLTALVEVHDRDETDRAIDAGASVIGVNQRDLRTFQVDGELAASLAPRITPWAVAVAESGIKVAADVAKLVEAGFQGVLVGETLVRSNDRRGAVAGLLSEIRTGRTP